MYRCLLHKLDRVHYILISDDIILIAGDIRLYPSFCFRNGNLKLIDTLTPLHVAGASPWIDPNPIG